MASRGGATLWAISWLGTVVGGEKGRGKAGAFTDIRSGADIFVFCEAILPNYSETLRIFSSVYELQLTRSINQVL